MFETWQDVIVWAVIGVTFLFGAPIIELIKQGLSKLFKVEIKDKLAVFVALVVAAGLALLQMFLSGLLSSWPISLDTFPEFLSAVFGVATVYFKLFMSGKNG